MNEETTVTRLKGLLIVFLMLALAGGATACDGTVAAETVPADQVPLVPKSTDDTVVAEAVIEPARWSELYFDTTGRVAEVLVSVGDRVEAGEPLMRLDTSDLEISLESARQDVIAQQAALDRLLKGASDEVIRRAENENVQQIAQAEIALKIQQQQLEKARIENDDSGVAIAQARVEQLRLQVAQSRAQDPAPDVTIAQVEVERTQATLDDAQTEYDESLDREWEHQDVRDGYARALREAKWNHQVAQAKLKSAQDAQSAHQISLRVLEAQIDEAEAQLAQQIAAQKPYSVTLEILGSEVEAAQLDLENLKAWENPHLDDPSAEEVAQAQVQVRKAELAVSQYELSLEEAELMAPFAGTVVDVRAVAGARVSPNQVMIVLATLDQLEARTIDLVELDVARVARGQSAVVSVDALPDREFSGTVKRIALQADEYRGDVTYAVTVDLSDSEMDGTLRWGMTAMVRIATD
jgi:HlyD family secretion protein